MRLRDATAQRDDDFDTQGALDVRRRGAVRTQLSDSLATRYADEHTAVDRVIA